MMIFGHRRRKAVATVDVPRTPHSGRQSKVLITLARACYQRFNVRRCLAAAPRANRREPSTSSPIRPGPAYAAQIRLFNKTKQGRDVTFSQSYGRQAARPRPSSLVNRRMSSICIGDRY